MGKSRHLLGRAICEVLIDRHEETDQEREQAEAKGDLLSFLTVLCLFLKMSVMIMYYFCT